MATVQELEEQLLQAKNAEKLASKTAFDEAQKKLKQKRDDLLKDASNMYAFARKEASEGNSKDAQMYQELGKKAEIEASEIILEGEELKAIAEPTQEEILSEYRQESERSNVGWFVGITVLFTFLFLRFGVWLKENYPDARIHDWATVHKIFSVVIFMFIIELMLVAMAAIRDNYLYRYSYTKKYFTLDIIKDFYETTPSNRLWLRFAYFGLRLLCAVLLASGNLI